MTERANRLPSEDRRAVTVEAVIELAAEQNPSTITTSAIAKHMGLTQGALFRHFLSKEAILQAVISWMAERLLSQVDKATQGVASPMASPMAALEAMFMANVDLVAAHPGAPRMMFGELQLAGQTAPKQMVQAFIGRYGERLPKLLGQGKVQGEVNPRLDVDAAVTLFIGTIQGLVMQSLLFGDVARIRCDAHITFVIYKRGIEAAHIGEMA